MLRKQNSDTETTRLFEQLLETANHLLGPDGCSWDRKQTLASLRESLLEETYEILEAIDLQDDHNLVEELGDLLYNIVFLAKIGEKEGRFYLQQSLEAILHKLISRHPHVFGEVKELSADAVFEQWQAIKKQEKGHRTHVLDGIPKQLPALARSFEIASKTKQLGTNTFATEAALGQALWAIAKDAVASGLNPELALRHHLMTLEAELRKVSS